MSVYRAYDSIDPGAVDDDEILTIHEVRQAMATIKQCWIRDSRYFPAKARCVPVSKAFVRSLYNGRDGAYSSGAHEINGHLFIVMSPE